MRENLTYGLMRQGMESWGSPAAPFLDPTYDVLRMTDRLHGQKSLPLFQAAWLPNAVVLLTITARSGGFLEQQAGTVARDTPLPIQ